MLSLKLPTNVLIKANLTLSQANMGKAIFQERFPQFKFYVAPSGTGFELRFKFEVEGECSIVLKKEFECRYS